MNQFTDQFGPRIKRYFDEASEEEQAALEQDLLAYANAHPDYFARDVKEARFQAEHGPLLTVVLIALSKDADRWGHFYVNTVNELFEQAKKADQPHDYLTYLSELAYIEDNESPFVQEIVDRLFKELESDHLDSKLAAIWVLPDFLLNPSIRNRSRIISTIQDKLYDANWKIRYVAYTSLGFSNARPEGFKLSFPDQLRQTFLKTPPMI
ncbi:MAG: hypothetical protein P0Y53_16875 [Candidatus Pseudobacter hemicellulosilyticus]|uniref:Uncharacterized protein n=1 Tax=Candidatus Pseudobacter hemicellulosilyticus TaxID=3121375 RepID=A0AAJ5WN37_9BACT|nr:MAG: hypothetical protein P0Y53_16875 [Pseudobacter sp.]